jgi:hypothetical protein
MVRARTGDLRVSAELLTAMGVEPLRLAAAEPKFCVYSRFQRFPIDGAGCWARLGPLADDSDDSRTIPLPSRRLEALRSNRKHPKRGEERRQCLEAGDVPGVDDARSMNGKGRDDGVDGRRPADLPQCHAG